MIIAGQSSLLNWHVLYVDALSMHCAQPHHSQDTIIGSTILYNRDPYNRSWFIWTWIGLDSMGQAVQHYIDIVLTCFSCPNKNAVTNVLRDCLSLWLKICLLCFCLFSSLYLFSLLPLLICSPLFFVLCHILFPFLSSYRLSIRMTVRHKPLC